MSEFNKNRPSEVEQKTDTEQQGETELSPEIIEKIMEKVQDINETGTAFTHLALTFSEEEMNDMISSVFKSGVLGGQVDIPREKIEWTKTLQKNKGPKAAPVFFNIIGRSHFGKGYAKFGGRWTNEGVTMIFDITKFNEVGYPLHRNLEDPVGYGAVLAPHTYCWAPIPSDVFYINSFFEQKGIITPEQKQEAWEPGSQMLQEASKEMPNLISSDGFIEPDGEYGFILAYRISPSLFKGLVISQESSGDYVTKLVKMIQKVHKDKLELLIPIYDNAGNLLWPKQMKHDEVIRLAEEKKIKLKKI